MAFRRIRSRQKGQRHKDSEVRWVVAFLLTSFGLLALLGRTEGEVETKPRLSGAVVPLDKSTALGELITEPAAATDRPTRSRTLRIRPAAAGGAIEIRKSSASYAYTFPAEFGSWTEITKASRNSILRTPVEFQRWKSIVLHASGTHLSDPELLASYHETALGSPGGLAYHFLIGADGVGGERVTVATRWTTQQEAPGGGNSIHVALAGDFEKAHVDEGQLRALHELIVLLRAQVGEVPVLLHNNHDQGRVGCLGLHFPRDLILDGLNPISHPALGPEVESIPN